MLNLDGSFCQSCAMPIETPKDAGTNADGTKSEKFCHFCFANGKFTEPDITLDQMIDKVIGVMMLMKVMPEEKVREIAGAFIPTLERWRS